MSTISRTRVDRVTIEWSMNKPPHLSAHFNCLDAEGHNLTGLGGNYASYKHAATGQNKQDAEALIEAIIATACELVQEFDEWLEDGQTVTPSHVFFARYGPADSDGQGVHVRYQRPGDVFEASLLFESHPAGLDGRLLMRYNQKHDVTDLDALARINGIITATFEAVEGHVHAMNTARNTNRRPGKWHK